VPLRIATPKMNRLFRHFGPMICHLNLAPRLHQSDRLESWVSGRGPEQALRAAV